MHNFGMVISWILAYNYLLQQNLDNQTAFETDKKR